MSRRRPSRSIHWYAGTAVAGVMLVLAAGAVIIFGLLRGAPAGVPAGRALAILFLLILVTGVFLVAIFVRTRRRLVGELDALVRMVERADPDAPEPGPAPVFLVAEFERMHRAFGSFFDRFSASRARQQAAEGTLGHVLEHAADTILLLDGDGRILECNRGGEETFGFGAEEMAGRLYGSLVPGGEEEPELRVPLAPGEMVKDFRTRRQRRDGSVLDVSITRSRVPSPPGDVRYVEILRDITATRRLEEDLLRSEKLAAVGKISSKVVHEIRNPLASINLNVDLLLESLDGAGRDDPETRENVSVIKREVRRLSQITEEYLQFSRLPRAAFGPERVNDLLVELSDFVRPLILRKGVRLNLMLDESDPEAVCDATLLRQALLNLLRNAVDATVEGTGTIQMTTRALWSGGPSAIPPPAGYDAVEISVEDNGCGIPPEVLDRVYDPFFTTKKDGTGLGLALVLRAVEEHGGSIRCASLVGKGTTFRMTVPCFPPAAPVRGEPASGPHQTPSAPEIGTAPTG